MHLCKHSLLPDFTGLLRPGKTFISQLRLEYWTSQLVASGRWGLLLGLLDLSMGEVTACTLRRVTGIPLVRLGGRVGLLSVLCGKLRQ